MSTTPGTVIQSTANSSGKASRLALGVVLSALSGLMLLVSFPPYGIWPLIWVGFVPYLLAQYRLMPFKWSSLAAALANLLWLGPFLGRLFGTEFGFFFTFLGVWIAILTLLISKDRGFHEITRYRWLVVGGAVAFVGFEMIRATFIPLVATSAFVGYTLAAQAWLIQPVSVFSVYGLDLLILVVNYSLALGAIALFDRRWKLPDTAPVEGHTARNWLAIAGTILAAWIIFSLVLLNRPREAARQGAQILYTPEMMFNFDPRVEHSDRFRAIAEETGTYVFITYTVAREGEPWRNEAVLLTPQGEFLAVYGKNHAFGEPPSAVRGVFPIYNTPLGRLATLICHDANYTDVARRLTADGAQVVAAPFHEFGGFGEQAWTNVLFRAVENRTAMVLTGVATVSALINPDGSLVALDVSREGTASTLVGDVTLGSGPTLYTWIGDVLGWISLAGFVFFIVFQAVTERRARQAQR